MEARTRARVLVVGDSGAGKSSLVHKVCCGRVLVAPEWTVGCQVEVRLLGARGPGDEPFFAELLDVGCHNSYELSRRMFYANVDAVLLVYDVSNYKSFSNLRGWISELSTKVVLSPQQLLQQQQLSQQLLQQQKLSSQQPSHQLHETGSAWGGRRIASLPVLVVGNKADLVLNWTRVPNVFNALGFESVNVSSVTALDSPGGSEGFDRIEHFIRCVAKGNRGQEVSYYNAGSLLLDMA